MPADQNPQSGRRQHFHRGRRGPDRRGPDRRPPQSGHERPGEQVDVEQIMREIRAQISQRHGLELSTQQIQELAARRLEAILDPRTVKPTLMEQLRRSAGSQTEISSPEPQPAYTFEGETLYETPNGLLRFVRRLLNPILRLFFNPNRIAVAFDAQTRVNKETAKREAERDRRQSEWNALHYTVLQRLVTEVSRVSIESQSLSMRVESLAAKVDYNERRVRGLEQTTHQSGPTTRAPEAAALTPTSTVAPATTESIASDGQSEGSRRRRRRRRGRRGAGMGPAPIETHPPSSASTVTTPSVEDSEFGDDEPEDLSPSIESLEPSINAPTEAVANEANVGEAVTSESVWAEPVSAEAPAEEPRPQETSFDEPVSHFELPEATPPPVEPVTTAEPPQSSNDPFPTTPHLPPDPSNEDR